jgi:hypothetical protein
LEEGVLYCVCGQPIEAEDAGDVIQSEGGREFVTCPSCDIRHFAESGSSDATIMSRRQLANGFRLLAWFSGPCGTTPSPRTNRKDSSRREFPRRPWLPPPRIRIAQESAP